MLYVRCLPRSRGVPTSFYRLIMMFLTNRGTPQYYSLFNQKKIVAHMMNNTEIYIYIQIYIYIHVYIYTCIHILDVRCCLHSVTVKSLRLVFLTLFQWLLMVIPLGGSVIC